MPPSFILTIRRLRLQCKSCTASQNLSRSISSKSPLQAIGPESPKYIEVPQPLQRTYPSKRRIKGILPTPRNVFRDRGANKLSPSYLAAVTPEPKSRNSATANADAADGAQLTRKERLAATRRRNLREGLAELYARKQKTEHAAAARSDFNRKEREAILYQKEREDERLTNPTVLEALQKNLRGHKELGRLGKSDVRLKRRRVRKHSNIKRRQRVASLHTLYMQARDFITTEAELDAAIDRIFIPMPPEFQNAIGQGSSIWSKGPPETVLELLRTTKREGGGGAEFRAGASSLMHKRMKKVAEKLTGGEM